MEEFDFSLNCPSCDSEVTIKVSQEDELPVFCPMCGEDVNENWFMIESDDVEK
jgi:endogenous inhibitor of DNA gyrase (YacG/DUF329 family)